MAQGLPMKKTPFLLLAVLLFSHQVSASAETILIDDFKNGISSGWKEKSFVGNTIYTPTIIDGEPTLQAESAASASGMFYEIKFNPEKMPLLSWRWKVEKIISKGDAHTKDGDDYSARIYVVFPSFLFWQTKALNYVWANKLPKGEAIPNAFTSNAMMVAVQSGEQNVGKWMNEQRNIYEDYKKLFGAPPPMAGAVAIMTDTDNTGEKTTAWYGPITLSDGQ